MRTKIVQRKIDPGGGKEAIEEQQSRMMSIEGEKLWDLKLLG